MPTYVYECEAGHRFEADQRITDEPLTECRETRVVPSDGNTTVGVCLAPCRRILIPGAGFVLKGKGWSKDGYSG